MKLSFGNIALTLIASWTSLVSAEETIFIAIRTLLRVEDPISAPELQAIDTAMNAMGTELDSVVKEVIADFNVPPARNLRIADDRALGCAPCLYYPSYYTGCWVNGVWKDRCRRGLTMHEDLSEEAIANLNEADRRRHLQVAALCDEAKTGVSSVIVEAKSDGIVPVPEGAEFVEQCFYEYP
jgi:hypothetical protein